MLRQAYPGIAEPRRSYMQAFARHVLELTRLMTLKDAVLFLGIGWDCVKDILKCNQPNKSSGVAQVVITYPQVEAATLPQKLGTGNTR